MIWRQVAIKLYDEIFQVTIIAQWVFFSRVGLLILGNRILMEQGFWVTAKWIERTPRFCQKIVDDLNEGGVGRPIENSKSPSIVDKSFSKGGRLLYGESV